MQVEDLRYYYDSFFSERTKEQFEEVILIVSKITESISQLDTCNALLEANGAINSVGLEKITSETLSDYKKQISNIKESIESDVKKLKRLKRRLPFRIDYSLYKEMKEEMDKATSKKDKISNKILLTDLRANINISKKLESIVDIIIEKKSECDENFDITSFIFALSLVENILVELYDLACFKTLPHYNRISMLLNVINIFNHYFETENIDINDLNDYLTSKYISPYNTYLLSGFILSMAEKNGLSIQYIVLDEPPKKNNLVKKI